MKSKQSLEERILSAEEQLGTSSALVSTSDEEKTLFQKIYFPIKFISESYFKPKSLERWKEGLIYRLLGVHIFKKIVPTCGSYVTRLTGFRPIANAPDKVEALKKWEPLTRVYETIHLALLCINAPYITEKLAEGDYTSSTIIPNLLINVYPVMLQRYNRARMYNVFESGEE